MQAQAEILLSEAISQDLPPIVSSAESAIVGKTSEKQVWDFGLFQIVEQPDGTLQTSEPGSDFSAHATRQFNPYSDSLGEIRALTLDVVQSLHTVAVAASTTVLDEHALVPARYTAKVLCSVIRQVVATLGWVEPNDPRFLLLVAGLLAERLRLESDQDLPLTEKRRRKGGEKGREKQKHAFDRMWEDRRTRVLELQRENEDMSLHRLCLEVASEELRKENLQPDREMINAHRKTIYEGLRERFQDLCGR